jgi:signal peptidase I
VRVDGRPIAEPYLIADDRSFPAVEVPAGSYYMLGDNRGNSDDSRYGLGTVPRDAVVGRAFVILWPPSSATFRLSHDLDADPADGATEAEARAP